MNATLYQMAVITQMLGEYNEVLRGYFPRANTRAITSAYAAVIQDEAAVIQEVSDGRYITRGIVCN